MRKFLAFMLLASAATAPALAAGEPGERHGWQHSSSSQSSDDKGNRSNENERPRANRGGDNDHGNSGQQQEQRHRDVPVMRVQSNDGGNAGNGGERRFHNGVVNRFSSGGQDTTVEPTHHDTRRGVTTNVRSDEPTPHRGPRIVEPTIGSQDAPDSVRDWRRGERRQLGTGPKIVEPGDVAVQPTTTHTLRDTHRSVPSVFRDRVPIVSRTPREGTQPELRTERRRTQSVNWNTSHWRSDHRYDWKNHRRHHRSLFHLGIYFDPFGWNYRPYQIGWRLWPNYYNSSNYWLNDPWQYRLPYAPPGYRWIRYYDDAILVDTWNGQVVDVIYNFFW